MAGRPKRRGKRGSGGRRRGSGRLSLFSPKTEMLGVKITKAGLRIIDKTAKELEAQYGRYSQGDAVEYLARKATGVAMDLQPLDAEEDA